MQVFVSAMLALSTLCIVDPGVQFDKGLSVT